MTHITGRLAYFTLLCLLLTACTAPGSPGGAAMAGASPAASGAAAASATGSYEAFDQAACAALLERFAETVGTEASMSDAPLTSLPGASGTACTLSATANAAQSGGWNIVVERVSSMLVEQGWARDQQLIQADGPAGTVTGFRKGGSIAVLSARLTDDTTGRCPHDQPLAACDLPPEEQYYGISIDLATGK